MDPTHIMPAYQPLPFPLPVWLMQTLLVVGFFLHALPMNVILGGGFIAAIMFLIGKSDKNSYVSRAARALAISLPVFTSFAITQGIVPLLFIQLLYGPAFYTSSIIMAAPWLSLIGVILFSYYISYFVIYRVLRQEHSEKTAGKAALLLLVMGIGFALTGFMFSNNITLMQTPEKWLAMYQANSHGLNLNTKEPQLIARYLHFLLASFAVAGMTLGCFGLYMLKREQPFARWLIKLGSRIFMGVTLVQVPVGIWFLMSIPRQYAMQFMGGDPIATGVFGAAMTLMIVSVVTTAIASTSGTAAPFVIGLTSNALLILAMIVNRHQLRMMYLNPLLKPDSVAVSTQWDLLAIFLASAVALIVYLIWLSRLMLSAFKAPADAPLQASIPTGDAHA